MFKKGENQIFNDLIPEDFDKTYGRRICVKCFAAWSCHNNNKLKSKEQFITVVNAKSNNIF